MSLKYAILGFLSFRDMSGYDLKKALDASVQYFWHADQSQIYRTLRQLMEEGNVTQEVIEREDRLDRKVYSITPTGREDLHCWLTTPLDLLEDHDPFLIQIYFGGMVSDAELLHLLRSQLQKAREQSAIFAAIDQAVHQQVAEAPDPRTAFCVMLTLEYAARAACATIEWLESAIERVENKTYSLPDIPVLLTGQTRMKGD